MLYSKIYVVYINSYTALYSMSIFTKSKKMGNLPYYVTFTDGGGAWAAPLKLRPNNPKLSQFCLREGQGPNAITKIFKKFHKESPQVNKIEGEKIHWQHSLTVANLKVLIKLRM